MADNKLKNLVEQIQKFASPPPKPPAGYVNNVSPVPSATSKVFPTHGGHGVTSTWGNNSTGHTDIMTMQHALQNLAADVSSQINLQDVSSGDPRREQEAKARDAFGVFLTKNYMRNSKVSGIEYDPDPKVTSMSQKRPDDPTRMSVVMDTMTRIGNPKKGEQFVDGNWGPRTNAAVRDTYAFASGLLDFVDDINRFATRKIQIRSYNRENLQNLANIATVDNSLTPEQKSEAAPVVTQHVKAIQNMYEEVKNNILQHAAYRQFIEADVPFKTYNSGLTSQQIDILKKAFPQGFKIVMTRGNAGNNTQTTISVDDLTSLQKLQQWIQQAVTLEPTLHGLNPEMVLQQIQNQQESNQSSALNPGY